MKERGNRKERNISFIIFIFMSSDAVQDLVPATVASWIFSSVGFRSYILVDKP